MLLALLLWATAADPAVERLIDSAYAASSEFASATLLRILENGWVRDRKRAIQLAETAFDLASAAKRQVSCGVCAERPREVALLLEANACSLQLDRVSLQQRAVKILARLDSVRSLEFADRLPPPEQRQPRCVSGTPEGIIRLDDPPKEPPTSDLKRRWTTLMFGTSGRMLPEEQRRGNEWKDQFDQLLRDAESLELPDGLSPAEQLDARANLLGLLWWAAPSGPEQDRMLVRFLETARRSKLEREDPVLWFSEVKSVLDSVLSAEPSRRDAAFAALENSGSIVLSLYARLEKASASR